MRERWDVLRIARAFHVDPTVVESTWSINDVWDAIQYLDVLDDVASTPPMKKQS